MHVAPEIKDRLAFVLNRVQPSLAETLGIELLSIEQKRLVAKMPVDQRTRQPFGLLHGGASVALAETLASIGALLQIDTAQEVAVGLEINANHLRSVKSGFVTGTAIPLHIGKRTQVWQIDITNEAGKLICTSRCTLATVQRESPGELPETG